MQRPVVLIVGAAAGAMLVAAVGASAHTGLSLTRLVGVQTATSNDEASGAREGASGTRHETPEPGESPSAEPTEKPEPTPTAEADNDTETNDANETHTDNESATGAAHEGGTSGQHKGSEGDKAGGHGGD